MGRITWRGVLQFIVRCLPSRPMMTTGIWYFHFQRATSPLPFSPLYFHLHPALIVTSDSCRPPKLSLIPSPNEGIIHPVPRRRNYLSRLLTKVSSIISTNKGIFLVVATSSNNGHFPKLSPPRHRWCSMSKRHVTKIKIHLLTIVVPLHRPQEQHRHPLPSVASASWRGGGINFIWSQHSER